MRMAAIGNAEKDLHLNKLPAIEIIDAKELLLKNRRFDLIFKYTYLNNHELYKSGTNFYEDLYCEHIRAFNNFYEEYPRKESKSDFLQHFIDNKDSIDRLGFDVNKSIITVDENYELTDGSHRISICAFLGKRVHVRRDISNPYYDYKFFFQRGIKEFYADFAALEQVKLNPNAYIVSLHSVTSQESDNQVADILNKYGFIYYKKDIDLTYNGYVNLKKISYGFDYGENTWLGNLENDYAGAKYHTNETIGKSPLRSFVFICDSLDKVIMAKKEIRDIYKIGNFSVHINDYREEAIELAQTFFNKNSLWALNKRPYNLNTNKIDGLIIELKDWAHQNNIPLDSICASGSTPFAILGIRESRDLDFLHCSNTIPYIANSTIASHESELSYYTAHKFEIIHNPINHFYYKGIKFITLNVLKNMKKIRDEIPKDRDDIILIDNYINHECVKV